VELKQGPPAKCGSSEESLTMGASLIESYVCRTSNFDVSLERTSWTGTVQVLQQDYISEERAPAKTVPAAAVRQTGQVFGVMTGFKTQVDGNW